MSSTCNTHEMGDLCHVEMTPFGIINYASLDNDMGTYANFSVNITKEEEEKNAEFDKLTNQNAAEKAKDAAKKAKDALAVVGVKAAQATSVKSSMGPVVIALTNKELEQGDRVPLVDAVIFNVLDQKITLEKTKNDVNVVNAYIKGDTSHAIELLVSETLPQAVPVRTGIKVSGGGKKKPKKK